MLVDVERGQGCPSGARRCAQTERTRRSFPTLSIRARAAYLHAKAERSVSLESVARQQAARKKNLSLFESVWRE